MLPDARAKLAAMQAELVSALAGRGAPPPGFDAKRLRAVAASLAAKRLQAVARAWPALAEALGGDLAEHFGTFVATVPLPRRGGPLADGRAFVRWLAAAGALPDAGRLEALAVDLRFTVCADGLKRRRGPAMKAAWLRRPRRLIAAVRLPGIGEWWLTIPWGLLSRFSRRLFPCRGKKAGVPWWHASKGK
jgi:hypothetical protein